MGLFSRPKLPANLSGFQTKRSQAVRSDAIISMPELATNYSCTFLMGPMSEHKSDELIHWLERETQNKVSYSPEEIVWSISESLNLNSFYFPDRHLVPLDRYKLYQARLNEYLYSEVSDIVKIAKVSMRKGNPLEFIYSSQRNFINDNWQEASAHTVIVKSMDEEGFVGMTALGPRRFIWQRVEEASLLEEGFVAVEKALRFDFVKERSRRNPNRSYIKELLSSRLVMTVGEHKGKGVFSYGYPHFESKDLGFGNS